MGAKFLLLFSALIMIVLGGVLIGVLGLGATPIGGNVLVLFTLGALTGFAAWVFVTLTTLSLCSEIMFVTM